MGPTVPLYQPTRNHLVPVWGEASTSRNLPNTHVEEPPTAPIIPTSLSSKSKQALYKVPGVSGSSEYTTSSQPVTYTTGTGSQNRRPSSDLSSDNSLTTRPTRAKRLLAPIYGPARLPLAVSGTGGTAPVSLPTQTPGAGRTNHVNLPPMQQPQNPDGIPPLGAVNELPAPTNTASTRGRGTGNRGKKLR